LTSSSDPLLINSLVNFNSPIPYYIQVKDRLKEQISQGLLKYGDQLPGEPTLCQLFSVSRTVIRQALAELEQEGFVSRRKGIGTFISEPEVYEKLSEDLTGFYQDMKVRGRIPFSQMLKQEITSADPEVAKKLKIEPGYPVLRLYRLRYVDHEPIVLTDTYLPGNLVPGLEKMDLSTVSLYEILEKQFGLVVARSHRTIGATVANDHQADLFKIGKGDPLIVIDNITYTADGTPIEYYHGLYRGDRNIFEVEMIRKK